MKLLRSGTVGLTLLLGLAACEGDPVTIPTLDIETMAGFYDITEIMFDPQGSAPAGDVLAQIQQFEPFLNVSPVGVFQLVFVDPSTRLLRLLQGDAEPTEDGLRLVFTSQAAADELLFPRVLELVFTASSNVLSFQGAMSVPRDRLLQFFPELYADEAFQNPTPGDLSVQFRRQAQPQ